MYLSGQTKLILPASVMESPRIEVAQRAKNLVSIVDEHNLRPAVLEEGQKLRAVLENHNDRLELTHKYLDSAFPEGSEESSGHSKLVLRIVAAMLQCLGVHGDFRLGYYAPTLHDIGKLVLPGVLMKAIEDGEIFTTGLRELMKVHALTGYMITDIATRGTDLEGVADIVYAHHEEVDGLGYLAMKGDEIPSISMAIAVADAYLAISRKRNYDPASPHIATLHELKRGTLYYENGEPKHLDYDREILRTFNAEKLRQLQEYCVKKYNNQWKEQYRIALLKKLDDNVRFDPTTGMPRRLPEGFKWDYEALQRRPITDADRSIIIGEIEEAYMFVRLAAESKYFPSVVSAFEKSMKRYKDLEGSCTDTEFKISS